MTDRFKDALSSLDSGVIGPGVLETIREALEMCITRTGTPFQWLDLEEWEIGQQRYRDWVGFGYLYKLVSHPRKKIHVYDLTRHTNFENSRKSVQKAISRATAELLKTQPDIGRHFQNNVRTGELSVYEGKWHWLL